MENFRPCLSKRHAQATRRASIASLPLSRATMGIFSSREKGPPRPYFWTGMISCTQAEAAGLRGHGRIVSRKRPKHDCSACFCCLNKHHEGETHVNPTTKVMDWTIAVINKGDRRRLVRIGAKVEGSKRRIPSRTSAFEPDAGMGSHSESARRFVSDAPEGG